MVIASLAVPRSRRPLPQPNRRITSIRLSADMYVMKGHKGTRANMQRSRHVIRHPSRYNTHAPPTKGQEKQQLSHVPVAHGKQQLSHVPVAHEAAVCVCACMWCGVRMCVWGRGLGVQACVHATLDRTHSETNIFDISNLFTSQNYRRRRLVNDCCWQPGCAIRALCLSALHRCAHACVPSCPFSISRVSAKDPTMTV